MSIYQYFLLRIYAILNIFMHLNIFYGYQPKLMYAVTVTHKLNKKRDRKEKSPPQTSTTFLMT